MDLVLAMVIGLAAGGGVAWAYLRQHVHGAFERGKASMDAERAVLARAHRRARPGRRTPPGLGVRS